MLNILEKIRDLSENQFNFLEMNQNRFDQILKEDQKQVF